jgi:hypothetical protein
MKMVAEAIKTEAEFEESDLKVYSSTQQFSFLKQGKLMKFFKALEIENDDGIMKIQCEENSSEVTITRSDGKTMTKTIDRKALFFHNVPGFLCPEERLNCQFVNCHENDDSLPHIASKIPEIPWGGLKVQVEVQTENKVHCSVCDCFLDRTTIERHNKTQKHLKNVEKKKTASENVEELVPARKIQKLNRKPFTARASSTSDKKKVFYIHTVKRLSRFLVEHMDPDFFLTSSEWKSVVLTMMNQFSYCLGDIDNFLRESAVRSNKRFTYEDNKEFVSKQHNLKNLKCGVPVMQKIIEEYSGKQLFLDLYEKSKFAFIREHVEKEINDEQIVDALSHK